MKNNRKFNIIINCIMVAVLVSVILWQRWSILKNCDYGYRYSHDLQKEEEIMNDFAYAEYIYQYGLIYDSGEEERALYIKEYSERNWSEDEKKYINQILYGGFKISDYLKEHTIYELHHDNLILYIDDYYTLFYQGKIYIIREKYDGYRPRYAKLNYFYGLYENYYSNQTPHIRIN